VAIGIDLDGRKDVLGLWTSANEGAKFWLQVLTELRNRGVKDIFINTVSAIKRDIRSGLSSCCHASIRSFRY
jgi:putative transposase